MLPTPPSSPKNNSTCNPEDRIGQLIAGSIQLISVLGIGAYGTVYKARDVHSHVLYAVKALNKLGLDPRQKKFQDREIQLHYAASHHPNVVTLVDIIDSPDCIFVVLEYCPEGDLFSKITEQGHYIANDLKAKEVFLQILSAVQHCHSLGVYHRDLKPENVLVTNDGWTVKLADFGLATQDHVTSDFGCGSTFYMSPECQQANPAPYSYYHSAPNDVWALGVILVNLTCGRNPWKRASGDDSTFRAFHRDRNFLKSILPISDELNCILQRIFDPIPASRITLDELRTRMLHCQHLTTTPQSPTSVVLPHPQSPLYSPASEARAAGIYDSVPQLELPPQQYPTPQAQYYSSSPIALTPPTSSSCSPQLSPAAANSYLYPKSAAYFFPSQLGNLPDFRRCGNMFPAFVPNQLWSVMH